MPKPYPLHDWLDKETGQLSPERTKEPVIHATRGRVTIETTPSGVKVSYRWFSYAHSFGAVVLILLIFDRLQVSPALNGFLSGEHLASLFDSFWAMLTSALLDVVVPIFLGYWVTAGMLNSTCILVDDCDLSIHHGPLPWPGNRRIRSCEISQLFVRQVTQPRSIIKLTGFRLGVQTVQGQEITLLEQNSPELAWLIRSRLESQLSSATVLSA